MWTLLSIKLGVNRVEFSLRGVADISKQTAKFQALCNGHVFFENADYEKRSVVMDAVKINQAETNGLQ